jgi:hypothetical protein
MSSNQNDPVSLKEYELNLDMWKHYDNLRQDKNKTFLTVNTILVAALGFALKDHLSSPLPSVIKLLVLLVSALGILVSVLWFLLLSRNAAYVKFHRARIEELEPLVPFATFSKQPEALKGSRFVWETLSSSVIDRLLATFVAAFWVALVIVSLKL